jgi:hypothetical protein
MIFELNYRNEREWTDGTKPIIQITITMEIDENLERPSPNAIFPALTLWRRKKDSFFYLLNQS